jgi:hypothetical protein
MHTHQLLIMFLGMGLLLQWNDIRMAGYFLDGAIVSHLILGVSHIVLYMIVLALGENITDLRLYLEFSTFLFQFIIMFLVGVIALVGIMSEFENMNPRNDWANLSVLCGSGMIFMYSF